MNNNRRKEIRSIENSFSIITTLSEAEKIKDKIMDVLFDEEYAFDSLSEGLQCTARGESMEEAIDELNGAIDEIDSIIEILKNKKEYYEKKVKVKVRFRRKKISAEEMLYMCCEELKEHLLNARCC